MTATELRDLLFDLLTDPEHSDQIRWPRTFEEAGVMTRDAGLVVQTPDGREFQITIVRSH